MPYGFKTLESRRGRCRTLSRRMRASGQAAVTPQSAEQTDTRLAAAPARYSDDFRRIASKAVGV